MPLPMGTPVNIRICLIFLETRVNMGYIFATDSSGLSYNNNNNNNNNNTFVLHRYVVTSEAQSSFV